MKHNRHSLWSTQNNWLGVRNPNQLSSRNIQIQQNETEVWSRLSYSWFIDSTCEDMDDILCNVLSPFASSAFTSIFRLSYNRVWLITGSVVGVYGLWVFRFMFNRQDWYEAWSLKYRYRCFMSIFKSNKNILLQWYLSCTIVFNFSYMSLDKDCSGVCQPRRRHCDVTSIILATPNYAIIFLDYYRNRNNWKRKQFIDFQDFLSLCT